MAYSNSVADLMGVPSLNDVQPSDKNLPDDLNKTEQHLKCYSALLPRTTEEFSVKQGFVQLNILPKDVVKRNLSDKKYNMYLECLRFDELPKQVVTEASKIEVRKTFLNSLSDKHKEKRRVFKCVNGMRKDLALRESSSKKCLIKYFTSSNQQYRINSVVQVALSRITKSSEEGYSHKIGNVYLKQIDKVTFKVLKKCETSSVPVKKRAICPFISQPLGTTSVVKKGPLKILESTPKNTESTLKSNESTLTSNESTLKIAESTLKSNESTLKINESTPKSNESTLKIDESTLKSNESPLKIIETKAKTFHKDDIQKHSRKNGMRCSHSNVKTRDICSLVSQSLENTPVAKTKPLKINAMKEETFHRYNMRNNSRKNGMRSSHSVFADFKMKHESSLNNLKVILEDIKKSNKGNGWSHISGSLRLLQTGENAFRIITVENVNPVAGTNKCYVTELSTSKIEISQCPESKSKISCLEESLFSKDNQCLSLCKENCPAVVHKSSSKSTLTDEENQDCSHLNKSLDQSNSNLNCASLKRNCSSSKNSSDTLVENEVLNSQLEKLKNEHQEQRVEELEDTQIEKINENKIIYCLELANSNDKKYHLDLKGDNDSDSSQSSSKPSDPEEWLIVDEVSNDGMTNMETNLPSENIVFSEDDCDKTTNYESEAKFGGSLATETDKNIRAELLKNNISTSKMSEIIGLSDFEKCSMSSNRTLFNSKNPRSKIKGNSLLQCSKILLRCRKPLLQCKKPLLQCREFLLQCRKPSPKCKKLLLQLGKGLLKKYKRFKKSRTSIKKKKIILPVLEANVNLQTVKRLLYLKEQRIKTKRNSLLRLRKGLLKKYNCRRAIKRKKVLSIHKTGANRSSALKNESADKDSEWKSWYGPAVSPVSSESPSMKSEVEGLQEASLTPIKSIPEKSPSPDIPSCPESLNDEITKLEFASQSEIEQASSVESLNSSCTNDLCNIDLSISKLVNNESEICKPHSIFTVSENSIKEDLKSDEEVFECKKQSIEDNIGFPVTAAVNFWDGGSSCSSSSPISISMPPSNNVKFAECVYSCRKLCVHERLTLHKKIDHLSQSTCTNGNICNEVKGSSIQKHSQTRYCRKDVILSAKHFDKSENGISFNLTQTSEPDSDLVNSIYFRPFSQTELYAMMQNCNRPSNNTQQQMNAPLDPLHCFIDS